MGWELCDLGGETITILGCQIVGKQRPRATYHGNVIRLYTPGKTRDFEQMVRDEWLREIGDEYADFDGPVDVMVTYARELAKSNPKYWVGRADLGKPDIDNVLKAVLDALNGVAYKDDSQVVKATCEALGRGVHGRGGIVVTVGYYEETYENE